MSQQHVNQAEWENPGNWSDRYLGLYFSKRDSRIWVPKPVRLLGWTVNLAHPAGALLFTGILLLPAIILAALIVVRG